MTMSRDAMAKSLYDGLFAFLVESVNASLFKPQSRDPGLLWIGILDVFGFENFEQNSFEQVIVVCQPCTCMCCMKMSLIFY